MHAIMNFGAILSSSASSFWLESMSATIGLLFFSFTFIFSLFSLLIYILRIKPWCNCDVCRAYLSSSWTYDYSNLCDWYTYLLRKSPTGTIHVHVLDNVITSNTENVEYMLKTRFDNYPKGQTFSTILGDLLGRGIFNVDGDSWKFQRKMASLELGSVSIRDYALEIVNAEICTRLVPLLASAAAGERERVLDLQDVFRRFSFDNISIFSFGLDPGCLEASLPESNFAAAFDLASKLSAQRAMTASPMIWKIKRFFNIGSEKTLKEAVDVINGLAQTLINQRREMGFSRRNDLLSRFMKSVDDDDEYLRDIVVSFLLAGRDTVAAALTSFFYLLSHNPEVESLIRDEFERAAGSDPDIKTLDQMRELHYLHAALHESMRLYPPVQFDSKYALEDDILPDGTIVRKGARVTYHPYAMGRMERIWGPDYLEFKPDRWLKDGVFVVENPFKYPVFQAGSRVCLGKELALMEMKATAIALIHRFDIRVVGKNQAPLFSPGLTATVRGGLPVAVRDRNV